MAVVHSSALRARLAATRAAPEGVIGLVISILALSWASPLIRFAQGEGVPSTAIVAIRLCLATLILTPLVLRRYRDQLRRLTRADLLLAGLAGAFLAMNFLSLTLSLSFTTVLVSMLVGRSDPIWVPLLEGLFLRVYPGRLVKIALVITLAGAALIGLAGGAGSDLGSQPLMGGLMALASALAFSLYIVTGRKVRPKVDNLPYIWLVYGSGMVVALIVLLLSGTPVTGYSPRGYLWVLLLALGPHLLGHSLVNYSLRFFTATLVGLSGQLVIVGNVLLALLLFHEVPAPLQLLGALAIVAGIILASLGQERASVPVAVIPEESM